MCFHYFPSLAKLPSGRVQNALKRLTTQPKHAVDVRCAACVAERRRNEPSGEGKQTSVLAASEAFASTVERRDIVEDS